MPALLERRACLVALTSLALAAAPMRANAAPESEAPIEGPSPAPGTEPDAASPNSGSEPDTNSGSDADTPEPDADATAEPELEVSEVEPSDVPSGGGVAGAIVDPDDPNAGRAQSDLEGESLDSDVAGVPERLPKLQAAGWWTTFGAVALATTGGIFAGIAEVREDEAKRLAHGFDLEKQQSITYGSVAAQYERLLDEGNTYQWVARGFIIAGGVALVASVALFAVDGAQRRKTARREAARLRLAPSPGGLTLQF